MKLYSNYISVLEIAGQFLGLVRSALTLKMGKGSIIQTVLYYITVRVLDNGGKNIYLINHVSTHA